MKYAGRELVVYDIETNGLQHEATLIHTLCWCKVSDPETIYQLTDYDEIREFILSPNYYRIGHSIILYDEIVLAKILNIEIESKCIDTLALSWYLNFERNKHGLESYGEEFNVLKPIIKDWRNLTSEEYINRCTMDVRINTILFKKQYQHLKEIYETEDKIFSFIKYLEFKLVCFQHQLITGIDLDVDLCKNTLEKLEKERTEKIEILGKVMPPLPLKSVKTVPKVMYKKDGTISAVGQKWLDFLKEQGLPESHDEPVEYVTGYEQGNPSSHVQIKDWLYSLGWIPQNIQHKRDKKTGKVTQIPQIKDKENKEEICDSVKILFDKEPNLKVLEGLSIISHRISIFKGFLRDQINGKLYPTIIGLTNTLRAQHSVIQNLPALFKPYGEEIRGCLVAGEGYKLIGSDLSGVEDNTKRHYIYKYDPDYVNEILNDKTYDPHLDIAQRAGYLTAEQVLAHKEKRENYTEERYKGKQVNFSATYKVGAKTLSRNGNMPIKEAEKLLEVFWKRNWAILEVEKHVVRKKVRNIDYLQNPLNGFWYVLRNEKDIFSTLNQGSAVWVFDLWLSCGRKLGLKPVFQYHDEQLLKVKKSLVEESELKIKEAIKKTNDILKLNVYINCSVDSGDRYSECH